MRNSWEGGVTMLLVSLGPCGIRKSGVSCLVFGDPIVLPSGRVSTVSDLTVGLGSRTYGIG